MDNPVITQPWGANKTGGVGADPNGTAVQQLVFNYGNYQPMGHDGIDYGCPIGTPVYAPGDAVVDYAGWGENMPEWVALKYGFIYGPGGWPSGIVTCLDHGPIGSYMAHKQESYMDARVGQRITAGTLVGLSGNTGRSGGPHVHFSAIRFPVNYSDPLYSRVNPLDHFSVVTNTPIRPGSTGAAATEEDDMALTNEDIDKIADRVLTKVVVDNKGKGQNSLAWVLTSQRASRDEDRRLLADSIKGAVATIVAAIKGAK
ncbi:hypothetical protein ASF21_12930 [Arthrobacter sp. Leaf234]|uniref:M23 family metallopeptidase n=1 Tax=Arthrobacter sp. Leaf234 TaxID=1736303 RepID=UPI0006F9D170|nr:M23 family metallopeptidase [Arthrobacter sp. Leaf234]KQN99706.1 hypothetical protein ASF21_12930 [Arthrobacter sp. Leaf234]